VTITHPFAEAVLADDFEAALSTLADDVVFRSPAVYKPYEGKAQVELVLRLVDPAVSARREASEVIRRMYSARNALDERPSGTAVWP